MLPSAKPTISTVNKTLSLYCIVTYEVLRAILTSCIICMCCCDSRILQQPDRLTAVILAARCNDIYSSKDRKYKQSEKNFFNENKRTSNRATKTTKTIHCIVLYFIFRNTFTFHIATCRRPSVLLRNFLPDFGGRPSRYTRDSAIGRTCFFLRLLAHPETLRSTGGWDPKIGRKNLLHYQ